MKDGQEQKTSGRSAFDLAVDFLARRIRTEKEVRAFLAGKVGYGEAGTGETDRTDEADEAVERLKELGYIDDRAYAARYLEILVGKKRGRRRIREEMRRRGLDAELIEETLADDYAESDERENALRIASNIFGSLPEGMDARKAAQKISSRLVTQGYSYDLINSVIGELLSP
ncbi:MAG: RecX family transcriptional regulator, partial [Clostridiales Family XIII bacterium]|nr:RecX family transcriptional regulator [Clostridiales Family XIII bacterium]